ncbi:hypothetical protein Barb7_02148 [Bacteroidales bacterium Barb7]|nr:hypothetical protein Barb7_02148 [Bacteroidales bacterium Barb7]
MYCIVNHHLRFVSPFQGFIGLYPSITPHSAVLHVGLKSGVLSELHRVRPFCNPTFRSASCGAEIGCPFRTPLPLPSHNPYPSNSLGRLTK